MNGDFHIRLLTRHDIPTGLRLSGQNGWNQLEADWARFLAMQPDGCFATERAREIGHFVTFGLVGLLTEWFLMAPPLAPCRMLGQVPWPVVLGFQMGMCSFWTTVTTAPRMFLNPEENHQRMRKRILRFYIPFFAVVYLVVFSIPDRSRLGPAVGHPPCRRGSARARRRRCGAGGHGHAGERRLLRADEYADVRSLKLRLLGKHRSGSQRSRSADSPRRSSGARSGSWCSRWSRSA